MIHVCTRVIDNGFSCLRLGGLCCPMTDQTVDLDVSDKKSGFPNRSFKLEAKFLSKFYIF